MKIEVQKKIGAKELDLLMILMSMKYKIRTSRIVRSGNNILVEQTTSSTSALENYAKIIDRRSEEIEKFETETGGRLPAGVVDDVTLGDFYFDSNLESDIRNLNVTFDMSI